MANYTITAAEVAVHEKALSAFSATIYFEYWETTAS